MIRAVVMLLSHIGFQTEADKLDKALDICTQTERKVFTTGRSNGATSAEVADYIMQTIEKM